MATIEKRGKRQWRAKIRRKGYPSQTRTFDSKTEAEEWARSVESEMDRGIFISRAEAESTTLFDALERFILEMVPAYAHPETETRRVKGLQRRALSRMTLAAVRIKDIAEFIRERDAEGVQANTIRLDLATLSRLFEVAATDWGMESLANPVKRVSKPKIPGGRTRRLGKGEEQRLIEASPSPFRDVIRFALETSMRRGEIASLRWEQVDLKNRVLFLPKTKNHSPRSVPLSPLALQILRDQPRHLNGSVFSMSPNAITKAMRRARATAGIPDLQFHDLRHEAISSFFEETDLDAIEIAEISGHKSMQMLKRYSHLRTKRLAARLAGRARTP
ncbi:MAG: tyrosine-type recombinase/integrase [Desulfovibrionaceae bacterium]